MNLMQHKFHDLQLCVCITIIILRMGLKSMHFVISWFHKVVTSNSDYNTENGVDSNATTKRTTRTN